MRIQVIFSVLFAFTLLLSCDNNQTVEKKNKEILVVEDYFFPSDSLAPYIYVYSNEKNPIDEQLFRIYKLITPGKNHLIVEKFNSDFRIKEGFTYDLDSNLSIVDHMIVDAQGMKRQANLTETHLYPTELNDTSLFISDFPAHLDSMMGVYKSKKTIEDTFEYEIFGEKTNAIEIRDEVTLSFVNPYIQKGSSNTVEIRRIFAKGFGLTEWFTPDKKIHFKLKRILTNSWWMENAQGPVVRGVVE
jgi:hypothetical protein